METDTSKKFSPSKLDTYENCPRRYQYRYVDKIKRDRPSIEAHLGTAVHAALEKLYDSVRHGKILSLEPALQAYETAWEASWSDLIEIRRKEFSVDDYRRIGRECVESYYEAHKPFDRDKTVDVERRVGFSIDLDGAEIRIEGFVDRLAIGPDGAFEVHDYKTGAHLPTQEDADKDRQLAVYELAVRRLWPDVKGVRLVWHYLRHGKDIISTRGDEARESLRRELETLLRAIKNDHEFAPKKSALCDWCEYRDLCPYFRDEERLKRIPPEKRGRDAGVKLVKDFAELDQRKKACREEIKKIDKELKKLESELIELAREKNPAFAEGTDKAVSIAGLEGEVIVAAKEEVKFPSKTRSPERLEEMEAELKETPQWRDISRVDPHRLMDGIREKRWEESAVQALERVVERYADRVSEMVLRFHRRKDSETD